MSPPLVLTAVATGLAMVTLWLVSLARRDASIIDVYWGPGFVLIVWLAAARGATFGNGGTSVLVAALVTAWGMRLGAHLLFRNWGAKEDHRYRAFRESGGRWWPLRSLATVFLLQGGLMWTISLPLQLAVSLPGATRPAWLVAAGAALWLVGFGFEALGDWQLARFRADPRNAGRVLDRGLWRYTRHPNYFGECLVWWGFYLVCLAHPVPWYTVFSPIVMTVLLVRVSGVRLLESTITERRPDYAAYVRRTNAFVPGPVRPRR